MRKILAMILTPLIVGCTSVSESAICSGTMKARDTHTRALINDGGPSSKVTGARLIGLIDAGCQDV